MSDFEDTVCIKRSKRMSDGIERHIHSYLRMNVVMWLDSNATDM